MTTSLHSDSDNAFRPSSKFWLLHKKVQQWVWEQKWNELRDIQEASIEPILEGNTDVVITAATAGGKTEAAFLPIFSKLVEQPKTSVQVLYISPLKALINDQYRRLSELAEQLEIQVCPWHGDVDSVRKQRLLKQPRGIVLITPESLEALFVLRGPQLVAIFAMLNYVVIDELHSFMGTERGKQLQSLLHRIELVVRRQIPRVGLSATLGDMFLAAGFLRPSMASSVLLIQSLQSSQEIKLQLRGYRKTAPDLRTKKTRQIKDKEENGSFQDEINIATHLFKVLRGEKNLIFINSRQGVEKYADLLRRMCESQHVPNEFLPHHSSLSKELRESAEEAFKTPNRPANIICTSTLEMGIDFDSVTSIAQVGTPYSVASTRQRLGRSGRQQGVPSAIRIYISEAEVTSSTSPEMALHPSLIQALAIVNLLLEDWYESPVMETLHLSTLVQQLLSLIAQYGGVRPDQSWQVLCQTGPFTTVSQEMFIKLLRSLGQYDLIQQSQDGLLLLGLAGERLVNHYSFYTAFTTPPEYRVMTTGRILGTLPITFPLIEGMFLIFDGCRWRVLSVDAKQRVVDLVRASAGQVPRFEGTGGLVHNNRVRHEMFRLYTSQEVPVFLDATAYDLLSEARRNFARYDLDKTYLLTHTRHILIFPWMGSLVMNTLFLQLLSCGIEVEQSLIALTVTEIHPDALVQQLKEFANTGPIDASVLATNAKNKLSEKYDQFLGEELLCQDYARRYLDTQGAWEMICRMVSQEPIGNFYFLE